MDARVGLWRKLNAEELMLLNCGVVEDSWESLRLQGDPTSPFWRRSTLGFLWREWCWSWNSSTLTTSCEELTDWKKLWCWEGLGAGGRGDDRGWDGWMASPTRWTWVGVNSERWWWTGWPGVLRFMWSQRVGHDWATELKWKCWYLIKDSDQFQITDIPVWVTIISIVGNSLAVQWLGLCSFTAKGVGSIPGQGTKIATSRAVRQKKKQNNLFSPTYMFL